MRRIKTGKVMLNYTLAEQEQIIADLYLNTFIPVCCSIEELRYMYVCARRVLAPSEHWPSVQKCFVERAGLLGYSTSIGRNQLYQTMDKVEETEPLEEPDGVVLPSPKEWFGVACPCCKELLLVSKYIPSTVFCYTCDSDWNDAWLYRLSWIDNQRMPLGTRFDAYGSQEFKFKDLPVYGRYEKPVLSYR